MRRYIESLLLVVTLLLLVTQTVSAASYECGRDRVIDTNAQISDALAGDWNTVSHNMDRYDIHFFLYAAAKADVEAGNTVGTLALQLFQSPEAVNACGLDAKSVILGIAPSVDPNGPHANDAISEIWYASDAQRDELQGYFLSGHEKNIMLEFAERVDKSVVNGNWKERLVPEMMAFNETVGGFKKAPQAVVVQPTALSAVQPTVAQMPTLPPTPSSSSSGNGFSLVLLLFVFVLLCGAGYVIYRAYIAWSKRTDAQHEAESVRREAAGMFTDWADEVEGAKARAQVRIANIGEIDVSEIAALQASLVDAQSIVSSVGAELTALSRQTNMDPGRKDLTTAGYLAIVKAYTRQRDELRRAESIAVQVATDAEKLRETAGAAAGQVVDAQESQAQSASRVKVVVLQGFAVDEQKLFENADEQLNDAQEAMGLKRYIKAHAAAAEAIRLYEEAALAAEALPAQKAELEELYVSLEQKIQQARDVVDGAQSHLEALAQFNSTSYSDVVGNKAEADNRVEWADQNHKDMRVAIDEQDFIDARAEYDQAIAWLDEIDDLVGAISLKKGQIEEARDKVRDLIDEVKRSLKAAQQAVSQHDVVVPEDFEERLQQMLAEVANQEEALNARLPEYIGIVRALREVDTSADEVYNQTLKAAQALARLQGRIAEQKKEAEKSLTVARKYFKNHSKDVDRGSDRLLESAQEEWNEAVAEELRIAKGDFEESELVEVLEGLSAMFVSADKAADSALKSAEKDVEEANEPEYVVSTPSYSPSPSWGSTTYNRPDRTERSPSTPSWSHTPSPTIRHTAPSSSGGFGSSSGTRAIRASAPASSPARLGSSSGTRPTRG